jgi:Tfp pilus assembly protein PilX
MENAICRIQRERGVALILALLLILVMTILAASITFLAQTQTWTALNYRQTTKSRYAAEAGIQRTMNWLNSSSYTVPTDFTSYDSTKYPVQYNGKPVVLSGVSGVSSNYPDATVQTAFNSVLTNTSLPGITGATFSTYATLLSMSSGSGVSWLGGGGGVAQTWQITSQGNISNIRNSQVQVVATYTRTGNTIFTYAVAATGTVCKSIDLSSSSYTDSFNSAAGTYATTVQNSGANVATNGNMNLSGSAKIKGTFSGLDTSTGNCTNGSPGITSSSSATPIDLGTVTLSTAVTYPAPSAPSPAPPPTDQNSSGTCSPFTVGCTQVGPSSDKTIALSPNYQYGNISLSSMTAHLSAGTYNINSLNMSGGSTLVLDSVPVILNIAGSGVTSALNLSGGSVSNPTGIPANFQIVYGGSGTMTLSGGSGSYGVVYAPNSAVTMSGSSGWFGAVICNTLTDSGGSPVHYDLALQNSLQQVGNFVPIGFSWSKY